MKIGIGTARGVVLGPGGRPHVQRARGWGMGWWWATTGTRRMTMMTSLSCSTVHSMHLCVRAIQRWFWGGRCRGVPGLVWGGGYGGRPVRGLGHCGRGGGLQCGVLPLFFSFPPASCSHICPLLSTLPQLLSFSPCVYVQGRGWLIGLAWWLYKLVVLVEEGECSRVV